MTNPNIRIKRSAVPGKRPSNSQMELGELALNTNDGRIFTKKENVGIGTTVTLLNVWTENIGGGAYYNDGFVGIGITNPTSKLQIQGDTLVSGIVTASTFSGNLQNTLTLNTSGTGLSGNTTFNNSGASTFTVTSNATSANTNNTIVARNGAGGFVAGVVTATTFVGALSGTATSTTNIPNLSGDVSSVNTVTTLATVNSNVGTFGSAGAIPVVIVNGKGLVTGVSTVAVPNGALTLNVSGTGLSGSASFTANQAGASTFTVTSNATSANTNSTIVSRDGSGNFSAGTITANLTGNVTGNLNSTGVNTATTISGTTLNYNVGTITHLNGTNVSYSGIGTVGSLNIGSTQVISSARQLQNVVSLDATTTATIESAISNAPNTFIDLQVTGISTFVNGPVFIGSGTSTGSAEQKLQVTGGAYVSGNVGIGFTNPEYKLYVDGETRIGNQTSGSGGWFRVSLRDGTAAPAAATLTMRSSASSSEPIPVTQPNLVLSRGSDGFGTLLQFKNNRTGYAAVGSLAENNGEHDLRFYVGIGTEVVRFNNIGNVGIGITNPTSKLQIQGDTLVSGIVTATTFSGNLQNTLTLNTSGTGLSGSTTFNNSGASTFTVTSNATSANTNSTIVSRDGSGNFSAGTITANLTGTASNVTTNANLTGHVTSVGNAAVLGSFSSSNLSTALTDETGSGSAVFATSPTLVTPILGAATATSVNASGAITANSYNIGTAVGISTTITTGITTTAATTIDSFAVATFRSARLQIQIAQSTNYQASDILVIHNGTTASFIEYGSIATNDYLGTLSVTVSGGNVLTQVGMVSTTSATVKVLSQKITV